MESAALTAEEEVGKRRSVRAGTQTVTKPAAVPRSQAPALA